MTAMSRYLINGTNTMLVHCYPRGVETVAAQGRDEGHGAPAPMRCVAFEPLASCAPAAQRRHVGLDPCLIDEDQPGGIKIGHETFPALPFAGDVGTCPFNGEQAFF